MIGPDSQHKLHGIARQVRALGVDDRLDPEDLPVVFGTLRAAVAQAEETAVLTLRGQGVSWQRIGDALNITRQAAHQRYSHLDSSAERSSRRVAIFLHAEPSD